jgi:peptidoglycan hydrolase-like protein with peptidoglycan-binding domain
MGFNYTATHSPSVADMVGRMVLSETEQLACAAGEIVNNEPLKALRSGDWTNFARIYNGPNYAINNYDSRLRAAYQGFAASGTPDLRIRGAQLYLLYLSFSPGPIDGIVGKLTRDAMNLFQAREGLAQTVVLDDATFATLETAVSNLPLGP